MTGPTPVHAAAAGDEIRVGFVSDTGRTRTRNEDSFTLYLGYRGEEKRAPVDAFFAVADGMGGHDRGDLASQYIAGAVNRALTAPADGFPAAPADVGAWIEALVRRVNRDLVALNEERGNGRSMGSTLTLALVWQRTLFIGHVGDTRCYRLRNGGLQLLTDDDSWVAEQQRAGLLTQEEAANHPNRNWLTRCLGMDADPGVSLVEEPVLDGDRYLLCSDGLHGMVPDSTVALVLSDCPSPQDAARRLVELSNHAGGSDNITAIVFDVNPPLDAATTTTRTVQALAVTLPGGHATPVRHAGTPPSGARRLVLAMALLAGLGLTGIGAWLVGNAASAAEQPAGPSGEATASPALEGVPTEPAGSEVPSADASAPGALPDAPAEDDARTDSRSDPSPGVSPDANSGGALDNALDAPLDAAAADSTEREGPAPSSPQEE
jgi:PPM family protein phosphatase